jgi:osmotically-inducible protein OsmY
MNNEKADRRLEGDVRRRLEADQDHHVRTLARYEIAVANGHATLVGHVRLRQVARGMADVTRRTDGISSVDEQLVADDELEYRVASAIGRGPLNRRSRLVVRSEFGHVRIGGVYPSPEARAEALTVGASFPGVIASTGSRPSDLLS